MHVFRAAVAGKAFRWCGLVATVALYSMSVHATDIVAVQLQNTTAQPLTSEPITFGQPFRQGDVPSGAKLAGRLDDGTVVPIQLDSKATHSDGSLRHGVLSATIPSVSSSVTRTMMIVTAANGASGSAVALDDVLNTSYDAIVTLNVGGTVYTASARAFLQQQPETWLSGPLVSEWLIGGPVKTTGGVAHAHLAVYFHVRAYANASRVRTDIIVENGWTRVAAPGDFTYNVTITVGGNTRYAQNSLVHFHHARWHRLEWWGGQASGIYVRHDKNYLQDSRALSKLANVVPSESTLGGLRGRNSVAPMQTGDYSAGLPAAGAGIHLGPMTRPDALYALSTDRRAFDAMLANTDAFGSWATHYRDQTTGRPINISTPGNQSAGENGYGNGDFPAPVSQASTLQFDGGHAPFAAYLPYVVTGDRYYLEEMQFWANTHFLRDVVIGSNNYPSTWPRSFEAKQARDQAWSFRDFGSAAWITPDNDPLKAYLRAAVTTNLAIYATIYPQSNNLGIVATGASVVYPTLGPNTGMAPWMNNFFIYSLGRLVDLGYAEAQPLLNFFSKWTLGTLTGGEYCWVFAPKYEVGVRSSEAAPFFTTFQQVYESNIASDVRALGCGTSAMAQRLGIAVGEFQSGGEGPTSYTANMQPAVAAVAQSGIPGGQAAWDFFASRTNLPNYSDYPNYAVVPRTGGAPMKRPCPPPVVSIAGGNSALGSCN